MLKRSQRLSGSQFDLVIKKGRVLHSPLFIARILSGERSSSRVAGVAPVKVAKTSAARHLVRRRIYEAARPLMSEVAPGNLIILLAKQPAIGRKPTDLRQDIRSLFVKAKLLR